MPSWVKRQVLKLFSNKELSINTIFEPFYYVLIFCGLCPFRLKYSKTKQTYSTIPNSIYFNLSITLFYFILIVVFFVLHVQTLFLESNKSSLTDVIITRLNYVVELLNLVIFCITSYVFTVKNCFKYINILNKINNICYKELPLIDVNILYTLDSQVKFIIFQLFGITLTHLAINSTRSDGLWKTILVTFSFVLPHIIQFSVIFTFKVFILLVVIIFKNIQDILNLSVNRSVLHEGLLKVQQKHSKPPLRQMEQAFLSASLLCKELNKSFEILILISILQCFHATVSEAHLIYHGVIAAKTLTLHEVINCSVWLLWQILKLYIVASSGQFLKTEAKKVAQCLLTIPADTQDLRLLLEIQHFYSMMSSQDIKITVCGFFTVDSSLISSVISAATMYLAIFIQFDKPQL